MITVATTENTQQPFATNLIHKSHTAGTNNASVAFKINQRIKIFFWEFAFFIDHARIAKTIIHTETLQLACDAHAVFPEFGICGFDIAITPEGPKVLECNDNPSHMLYQLAAQRGVNNAELVPVWDQVIARQKKRRH